MIAAKYNVIRDLIRRESFKVILKQEVPEGANFLIVRFVLAIESTVDGEIRLKSRNAAVRHLDFLKDDLVQ